MESVDRWLYRSILIVSKRRRLSFYFQPPVSKNRRRTLIYCDPRLTIINSSRRNVGATRCHSRERTNAVRPFADGHARSARSNRGVGVSSEVRSGGTARLCRSARDPVGGVPRFSRLFLPRHSGTRDPASTSAHRPPPLHPQTSKRHDVPDLRRRATREQRGRPEHPRVEPPGASFARHLTHVHARVRRNAAADFVAFR